MDKVWLVYREKIDPTSLKFELWKSKRYFFSSLSSLNNQTWMKRDGN